MRSLDFTELATAATVTADISRQCSIESIAKREFGVPDRLIRRHSYRFILLNVSFIYVSFIV